MTDAQCTDPLPWQISKTEHYCYVDCGSGDFRFTIEDERLAIRIVDAVNSVDALRAENEALKDENRALYSMSEYGKKFATQVTELTRRCEKHESHIRVLADVLGRRSDELKEWQGGARRVQWFAVCDCTTASAITASETPRSKRNAMARATFLRAEGCKNVRVIRYCVRPKGASK